MLKARAIYLEIIAATLLIVGAPLANAQPIDLSVASTCREAIERKQFDTMVETCVDEIERTKNSGTKPSVVLAALYASSIAMANSSEGIQARLATATRQSPPATDRELAELNLKLGQAYVSEKQYDAAVPVLKRALAFEPQAIGDKQRIEAVGGLSDALLNTRQYADAIRLIEGTKIPADVKMLAYMKLNRRLSEGYFGMLSEASDLDSSTRRLWANRRWSAMEAMLADNQATPNVSPDFDCIVPSEYWMAGQKLRRGHPAANVRVILTFDKDGLVAESKLAGSSGLQDIDRRALEIGQRMQCRPNPAVVGVPIGLALVF